MANRIIAIGGQPATGKTTLMRRIIKHYDKFNTFKSGLVQGMYNKEKQLYIIGVYDSSLFSGTDKLSMAVQPHFIRMIHKQLQDATIVFEGDRLFNQSLFDKVECEIYVLKADEEIIHERHIARQDTQTDKFKKAKKTKIENIVQNNDVNEFYNNTQEQNDELFEAIINTIENGRK
jgi:dephospho-CoA kinase